MGMFKRKLNDWASAVYRTLCFPIRKMGIEKGTDSIIKRKAYLYGNSVLEGKNYIGERTELNHVRVGFGSYVNNGGRLTDTVIGKYTSIGPDVVTVIGKHPIDMVAMHPAFCSSGAAMGYTYTDKDVFEQTKWIDRDSNIKIRIGNDVWIGNGCLIMEGVEIGDGAVIGAGAVVTEDVECYSIYGGVPAKKIRARFDTETIAKLKKIQWWDKDEEWIMQNIDAFENPDIFIDRFGDKNE